MKKIIFMTFIFVISLNITNANADKKCTIQDNKAICIINGKEVIISIKGTGSTEQNEKIAKCAALISEEKTFNTIEDVSKFVKKKCEPIAAPISVFFSGKEKALTMGLNTCKPYYYHHRLNNFYVKNCEENILFDKDMKATLNGGSRNSNQLRKFRTVKSGETEAINSFVKYVRDVSGKPNLPVSNCKGFYVSAGASYHGVRCYFGKNAQKYSAVFGEITDLHKTTTSKEKSAANKEYYENLNSQLNNHI